ncbi:alpha/beta hydrolase family protein [Verrucomicrobiota bacterium]
MGTVPTAAAIAGRFRRNVALRGWRASARNAGGQPPVVFRGAQKALFDSLMERVGELEEAREKALARIRTRQDVMKRAAAARRAFRAVQGLSNLPARTPLKPRVRPAFERDGFRVEHVVFESRPDYYVVGNLYLPTLFRPPYPCVLQVEGHSENGKHAYQTLSSVLPLRGIAVFCFDPAGQGERDEYVDIRTGRRTVRRACRMHGVAGDPAYLIGTNFGEYRLWDGMRCVDYLQTRKDIAGSRIGVSGTSGGGWESLWLGAVDTRIKAVNSNCYLTTWRRRMENRGADPEPDPEQDPFCILAMGFDAADLILACAPRAVSLGATIFDFFPIDGALKCYAEAKRLFRIAGIEDRLAIRVDDAGHSMTPALRQQCYAWMQKWFRGDEVSDEMEPPVVLEDEKTVNCTRTGIVLTSLGGKTTAQLNAERAAKLARQRQSPGTAPALAKRSKAVKEELGRLLGFRRTAGAQGLRAAVASRVGALAVTPISIRSEGAPTLHGRLWSDPAGPVPRPAVIYLAEKTREYDWRKNTVCRGLARAGAAVLDLDPCGMGPLRETFLEFVPLAESDLTYDAFLCGTTVLGMRVSDVVRTVDALSDMEGIDAGAVSVFGLGYGALLGLFAACLDDRISGLVESRGLTSYSSLVWHREYAWAANVILPDVLRHFELEDVRAALAPKPLTVVQPLDHLKRPLSPVQARREYRAVRNAYRLIGATQSFSMKPGDETGGGREKHGTDVARSG